MTLAKVREWEELERQHARFANHLHFTLHCKHHNVTPVSLTLKTSVKGVLANNIIKKAQNALLNLRIQEINFKIRSLKQAKADISEELFMQLPSNLYTEVHNWVTVAHRAEWDRCRTRQVNKYNRLLAKVSDKPDPKHTLIEEISEQVNKDIKDRWVINKSDKEITGDTLSVLQKGLNFAITPNKLPVSDFVTAIESACKIIGPDSEQATLLRADCVNIMKNSKLPESNITEGERVALKDLKEDSSIMVLPADKGRATVVMNSTEYHLKCRELLSDTTTYKKLKKDPTNIYSNKLIAKLKELQELGVLTRSQYLHLYPTSTVTPKFYGLPKVHKPSCPLRPITASRGSIMYNTARMVADILSPLVGKTPHHLENSADLVKKLSEVKVSEDESLISYDVTALFTSVPIEESCNIILNRLKEDTTLAQRSSLSPEQVIDLLRLCLTTTYFKYDGDFYVQVEGAAMGSPVSPIVANLFCEDFEVKALASFPDTPKFWGRYVDDALSIMKTICIDPFTDHLNKQHKSIKFTTEPEVDRKLPMLDTLMTRKDDGSIKFSVYRKPTHTDQYLQFSSHQPVEHKMGVIRTLRHRANTLVSEPEDKIQEMSHLRKVLSVSGYTRWAWQSPGNKKLHPHPKRKQSVRPKGHVTLPFVRGVTEPISRRIRKAGVCVHAKPHRTIRSMLVAPKDKDDTLDKCGVVYNLSCQDCGAQYIGETERPLRRRIKEHDKESSPVCHHLKYNKHTLDKDNIKILDRESRWFERGVKEAIHIRSRSPSLNRDQGRHKLPPVYDTLVKSHDTSTAAAVSCDPHQS